MRCKRRRSNSLLCAFFCIGCCLLIVGILISFDIQGTTFDTVQRKLADQLPPKQYRLFSGDSIVSLNYSCEVVHVVIVCGGSNASFVFSVLLKSIIAHRSTQLYIHLLVDDSSQLILDELLSSWMISGLQYRFYDISMVKRVVSWISTSHYSGVYGLLKLTVPDLILLVDKVIVLDTDLLFMDDIFNLWKLFEQMQDSQVFAFVENQSDWYLGPGATTVAYDDDEVILVDQKKLLSGKGGTSSTPSASTTTRRPWPAVGRGYNSGLILMDLKKMRKQKIVWRDLWVPIAHKYLDKLKTTELADQDIFNAVSVQRPELVYNLPCDWNLQLSYGSKEELCLAKLTSPFRVIHMNHPDKSSLLFDIFEEDSLDQLFSNKYVATVEMNGYTLRSMYPRCFPGRMGESQSEGQLVEKKSKTERLQERQMKILQGFSPTDRCYELRVEQAIIRRVFPLFFTGRNYKPAGPLRRLQEGRDIGIVTQLSFDRLSLLEMMCQGWSGPISAAIYLSDADVTHLVRFLHIESTCLAMSQTAIHLVFREGNTYPVNFLRNTAARLATTSRNLILDVDFIPSKGAYDILKEMPPLKEEKAAVVVPAFESFASIDSDHQLNKTSLVDLLSKDKHYIEPFRESSWPSGHAATNFSRWIKSTEPYHVAWAADYEPYVVVERVYDDDSLKVPSFDERFVGFGWNKVSFIMELDAMGYNFFVAPDAFLVHVRHLPSLDLLRYRANPLYQACLSRLKLEFINDLTNRYGVSALKYVAAAAASSTPKL